MPDEMIIRHARPDDVEAFRALRLEALKNHPDVFGMDYFDSLAKNEDYWVRRLQLNSIEDALFFAEKDSQLLGMTGIHRSLAVKAKHSAMIWGVYVKPEWRGKYLAQDLIRACLKWAQEQNVVVAKLAVVTHNRGAIRCYEQCGFKIYGTEPKAIFYSGKYYDEYLMALEII